jgi:hypothetical protein
VPGGKDEVEDTLQGFDLVVQLPELRSDVGRDLATQNAPPISVPSRRPVRNVSSIISTPRASLSSPLLCQMLMSFCKMSVCYLSFD